MTLPQSKADFCQRYNDLTEQQSIQVFSQDPINLLSFKNEGGLFNGGVCWWHSRFQRNIFYLSIFRPDLEKAKSESEIKQIIHLIRLGTEVINVPGYSNLEDFSRDNQKLIQAKLNDWQIYDGVVLGGWIDGLKGDTKVEALVLEKMTNELYSYVVEKKKVAYQKLQIKGITSHAWLVVGMKKMPSGYEIGYLDSNSPRMSLNYSYKISDTSFFIKSYGDFVPYLEFTREEQRLLSVGEKYCGITNNFSQERNLLNEKQDLAEAMADGAKTKFDQ